jgi:hypothetical protein
MHPATQDNVLPDVGRAQGAAIMATTQITEKVQLLHHILRLQTRGLTLPFGGFGGGVKYHHYEFR